MKKFVRIKSSVYSVVEVECDSYDGLVVKLNDRDLGDTLEGAYYFTNEILEISDKKLEAIEM